MDDPTTAVVRDPPYWRDVKIEGRMGPDFPKRELDTQAVKKEMKMDAPATETIEVAAETTAQALLDLLASSRSGVFFCEFRHGFRQHM